MEELFRTEGWAASTQDFLSVVFIPTDIADSFPIGLYLIYLEEKYRTHEYSELFPERLHLLAGDPFTFLPHGVPSGPLPCPFWGKSGRELMCISTQWLRCQQEKGQGPPDPPCLPLYFLEPSWRLPGHISVLWCLWAGWRWPWSEREQKNPQGKYRMWQKTEWWIRGGLAPLCQKCKSSRRLWAGNGIAESVERTLLHESGPTNRHTLGHRHRWNPREVYSRVKRKENLRACWVLGHRKLSQISMQFRDNYLERKPSVGYLEADPGQGHVGKGFIRKVLRKNRWRREDLGVKGRKSGKSEASSKVSHQCWLLGSGHTRAGRLESTRGLCWGQSHWINFPTPCWARTIDLAWNQPSGRTAIRSSNMSFRSRSFRYNVDKVPYKLNSCWFQLAYDRLVSLYVGSLKVEKMLSQDLTYLDYRNWQTLQFRTFFYCGGRNL